MELSEFQQELEKAGLSYDAYKTIRLVRGEIEIVWKEDHPTKKEETLAKKIIKAVGTVITPLPFGMEAE